MIPKVILLKNEYEWGVSVGRARQEEDDKKGLQTQFEANDNDRFKKHELGALCELAFWKFRIPFRPWRPALMRGVDVGDFQVRGTAATENAPVNKCRLPIRPGDDDKDRMALVIQDSPRIYVVRGWIKVGEGKKVGRIESLRALPAACWVDQSRLNEFYGRDDEKEGTESWIRWEGGFDSLRRR